MPCLLELDFLLKAVNGSILQRGNPNFFSGVTTDSRQSVKNKLFFALKGPRFDGHDFLNSAIEKGVIGCIVSREDKTQELLKNRKLTVIQVPDTLKALQELAQLWTQHLQTKVLAVTGSNGKTTSRAFSEVLCSSLKPFASTKSYNNSIGVPLSLLTVNRREAFLIQEIGTSRPGEIAFLTSLCDPLISAVTMVGPSHLEGLYSLTAIAQEKQQIYLNSPKALWVFNRDNVWTDKMFHELAPSHPSVLIFSSRRENADVRLNWIQESAQSSVVAGHIGPVRSQVKVTFSGAPNLENLMCASALALGAGIDPKEIWQKIPQCRLPKGRQEWFQVKDKNISIVFDAYNANPSSMDFFLQSCGKFSKPDQRLLVIGDMKELGGDSERYHRELAQHSEVLKSRFVAFVGEYAGIIEEQLRDRGFKGRFISSKTYDNNILSAVKEELQPEDLLAIKASRSLRLERLFFDLTGQKKLFYIDWV